MPSLVARGMLSLVTRGMPSLHTPPVTPRVVPVTPLRRYNTKVMSAIKFYDENTKAWWSPVTGGANIPAMNELLSPFGLCFGDAVLRGELSVGDNAIQVGDVSPRPPPRRLPYLR